MIEKLQMILFDTERCNFKEQDITDSFQLNLYVAVSDYLTTLLNSQR